MPANFKRRSRRVVAAVTQTPWMLLESSCQQMIGVLEMRHAGVVNSPEDVARLLATSDHGRGVSRALGLNFDPKSDDDFDGPFVIDGIAVLPMTGILAPRLSWMDEISGGTSTELFAQWFQQALADSRVVAIICRVDSPGGSASGNEELAMMIRKARGIKPAVAVAQGMIASAAYYNGSAFATLYASPSTEVGSIGCYMIHGESSIADKEEGYTYTVVKAGENKAAGNSVEPLTEKTKGVLQERIDAFYDQFVEAVASNRGKTVAQVEAAFGQGKVMIAEQALAAGMIDGVRTFDDVLAEFQAKYKSAAKPVRGGSVGNSTRTEAKEGQMDKIKAALVKMGLCAQEDDDKMVQAMLKSFCKARGVEVPKDEAATLALLESEAPKPAAAQPAAAPAPAPAAQQSNAAQQPAAQQPDAKAIALAERNRGANIRASGVLLGMKEDVIQAAIDSGKDTDTIMTEWRTQKGTTETAVGKVEAGASAAGKLHQGALESLQQRCGLLAADKMAPESKDLRGLRMVDLGKTILADQGKRIIGMNDEDIAKVMLGNDRFGETLVPRADAGYQRPGDFPGILSALVGKMLDQAEELGGSTFREWTGVMPSVPDFKPKTIHAVGEFGELPVHEDGKAFEQSTNSEEASWLQVDEFGDEWSLTPRMIANDDLDVLQDVVGGKQDAHDMTMERLCVNLLTGNVNAQDGNPLFGTTRTTATGTTQANDIASGAAPSTTQLSAMRVLARKIYGISGKTKLSQTLEALLIPEDLETTTEQLLSLALSIVPTTETNGQIFRGKCKWVVVPMLSESSATVYYGLTTSRRRAIVRAYQTGYENMRTVSYFDPKTGCRVWQFAGRMAAAVRTWRTMVRNNGA